MYVRITWGSESARPAGAWAAAFLTAPRGCRAARVQDGWTEGSHRPLCGPKLKSATPAACGPDLLSLVRADVVLRVTAFDHHPGPGENFVS